jgi:hypothetical protein
MTFKNAKVYEIIVIKHFFHFHAEKYLQIVHEINLIASPIFRAHEDSVVGLFSVIIPRQILDDLSLVYCTLEIACQTTH